MKSFYMKTLLLLSSLMFFAISAAAEDSYLVGAHFYGWYIQSSWANIKANPLLGQYASHEKAVISRQIRLASEYGIDFFGYEWSGVEKSTDKLLYKYFLNSPDIDKTSFCIAYDTLTRFQYIQPPPIDFNNHRIREGFLADLDYLSKKYFHHPRYLKFQGRPVVWLYLARGLKGNWPEVLEKARKIVQRHGYDLYLDGDLLWPGTKEMEKVAYFDAASSYVVNHRQLFIAKSIRSTKDVVAFAKPYYEQWSKEVPLIKNRITGYPVAFHPVITPQFSKPQDPQAVQYSLNSVEDFRSFAELAQRTATFNELAQGKVIWITSWNEWYEGSSIEPTTDGESIQTNYGYKLLEVIRDTFANR